MIPSAQEATETAAEEQAESRMNDIRRRWPDPTLEDVMWLCDRVRYLESEIHSGYDKAYDLAYDTFRREHETAEREHLAALVAIAKNIEPMMGTLHSIRYEAVKLADQLCDDEARKEADPLNYVRLR